MDGIKAKGFLLTIRGLGRFKRDGGDILWIGIAQNEDLAYIKKQLDIGLSDYFTIDKRAFAPHLTLVRQASGANAAFTDPPGFAVAVKQISLMKSERINGRLTYTEIYAKGF